MSEEILFALAQLYGVITKQDGGVTLKERAYVLHSFKKKLNEDSIQPFMEVYDQYAGYTAVGAYSSEEPGNLLQKSITVKDSVLTLNICNKINKTLTQKQKIIVVLELYELVKADEKFTPQRMSFIDTVSSAFNIDKEDIRTLENFVLRDNVSVKEIQGILRIDATHQPSSIKSAEQPHLKEMDGSFYFAYIRSAHLILFKFNGSEQVSLNGMQVAPLSVQLFTQGATVKSAKGIYFYYSDIQSYFRSEKRGEKLVLNAKNVSYKFSKNKYGLRDINLSECAGTLVGIMGSSGSGKTTLLNVLSGLLHPSSGNISVNGVDIHKEKEKMDSLIGYISQDDLLVEEITVYQNLYFNAQLTFKNKSKKEIDEIVLKTLENLGLSGIQHIEVGSIFNKKISGGQRKRLNIALELIREPSILFVDEPTSGLSSRDSENVIDLLKELTLKGKLIFVVIHQPSSDVYKMFDKIFLLDNEGYSIYYGPPIEAVTYLKHISKQVDREKGQCDCCGNVNPEQIFNIVEEKVVDEFGHLTDKRKKNPAQWHSYFKKNFPIIFDETATVLPPKVVSVPSKLRQWLVFSTRDVLTKLNNKQYLIINLLEAPVLAFFLAIVIRYKNNPGLTKYLYRYNENLPAYLLMSIIVAIFLGLSVSAEEIIKDKKNLKREAFLHLSRSSYLLSKLSILFFISAFQTLAFVLIGNSILEIKGMMLEYWLMLFSIACMANILGLIVSSSFSSAVAVYILIPLLLIPQMILSGAMFSFEKLNDTLKSSEDIPLLADIMGSRWAFEGLAVEQFKNNQFEKKFYHTEQVESISNFNLVYLLPELKSRLWFIETHKASRDPVLKEKIRKCFIVLSNEFSKQVQIDNSIDGKILDDLKNERFTPAVKVQAHAYIDQLTYIYRKIFSISSKKKEQLVREFEIKEGHLDNLKDHYFNESLSDLVRNVHTKNRILEIDGKLVPRTESIFFNPIDISGHWDYRSHFFSPEKHVAGIGVNTFIFNLLMVWVLSVFMYLILYFNVLGLIINRLQRVIAWN